MSTTLTLPNHWNLYNIRESPYFQDSLGEAARFPLHLFIGRDKELDRLLAGIGGTSSSRQAIGGAAGVGKTTLAQLVKATAINAGYWATEALIPFYPDDTVQRVMSGLLGGLYDSLVTVRPATAEHPTLQRAQQYVRAFRLSGGGANVSVLGIGAGASRSTSAITPAGGVLLEGPQLIRGLLDVALENAKGVVLHLNNLENLGERDISNAADILRSLRDPVLLQPGLHTLLVGTTDAITKATSTHPQLRSVFSLHLLEPLPSDDVQKLLDARYRFLRLHSNKRVTAPVTNETVDEMYALFRGDLRGLFKALEEGVTLLAGVEGKPGRSLSMGELGPALQQRYEGHLVATLSATRVSQLRTWAKVLGTTATPSQDELKKLWKLSQSAVSDAVKDLIRDGYVIALPREAVTRYALGGPSRLALDRS